MNLEIIKSLCESRGIEIKRLAQRAGMSEPNLHRCIRINKIQASDLEKISNILGVKIGTFFDEDPGSSSAIATHGDNSPAAIGSGSRIEVNNHADVQTIADLRHIIALYERIHPDLAPKDNNTPKMAEK